MSGSCDGCGGVCGECYCEEMAEQDAAYARFALHPLRPWTQALFYVCKAMGPPFWVSITINPNGDASFVMGFGDATEAWWAWFDAAQAWVRR